ncbi:hypothetical protein RND81_05G045600 [Saponaria officinalis]|uniref:Reverse transcriptase zinc-binding domain-containing protein n=1 Tax=Saponaria officinalis TaxID=3572 RepID=A0AAW1KUP4_SAPOF
MVYKSWQEVCLPWDEGGFDVREILSWNKALIAKHLWHLDHGGGGGGGGIWAKWVRLYNLSSKDIWEITPRNHHSQSFRALLTIRDDLVELLGDIVQARHSLHRCAVAGTFSVTAAYHLFRSRKNRVFWARALKDGAVPRHGIIASLASRSQLPTVDNISRRGLMLVNRCSLCKVRGESHRHLFFRCSYSYEVWQQIFTWMSIGGRSRDLITELHWTAGHGKRKHWKTKWFRVGLAATVYFVWNERNFRVFNGVERSPASLVRIIKYFVAIRSLSISSPRDEAMVVNALNS